MLKLIPLLGLLALASGCAGIAASQFTGFLNSPNATSLEIHNQTEVKLTESNFVTVKTNVIGQCDGFALLGVVTIVPAKFTRAMDRLYHKAEIPLGRPQTLADVIVEKTSSYWILFSIPKISVRADVVEFTPNPAAILVQPSTPPVAPNENKGGNGL